MRKINLLHVGEFSKLNTGYSSIADNLLTRFHRSGKYNIVELAAYIQPNDPRIQQVPWKVIGNAPINEQEAQHYGSNPIFQFGKFRFEEVCMRESIDLVMAYRDPWMDEFIIESPFRNYYNFVWSPTTDARPAQKSWVSQYCRADAVFSYTDWGFNLLKEQGQDRIPLVGVVTPPPDEVYQPVRNKKQIREMFGLDPNNLYVLICARNQKRKLYSDLFEAFAKFLKTAPIIVTSKAYLICHTSVPDQGWDMAGILNEFGVSSRVLFSYKCRSCGKPFINHFQDARSCCDNCGKFEKMTPNTQIGFSKEEMNLVHNLPDVYVQYSLAESPGLPILSSVACGVPTMVVNYSGMEDFVKKLKCVPINIQRFVRESESGRYFAMPDNDNFIEKLSQILQEPAQLRERRGMEHMRLAKQCYNWDRCASAWMNVFDKITPKDWNETWGSPPKLMNPATQIPDGLDNARFVEWAIVNVLGDRSKIGGFMNMKTLADLNTGQVQNGTTYVPYTRQNVMHQFTSMRNEINHWEQIRYNYSLQNKSVG
jgi:glycosyltransferase involved in cell wall biosynthesis